MGKNRWPERRFSINYTLWQLKVTTLHKSHWKRVKWIFAKMNYSSHRPKNIFKRFVMTIEFNWHRNLTILKTGLKSLYVVCVAYMKWAMGAIVIFKKRACERLLRVVIVNHWAKHKRFKCRVSQSAPTIISDTQSIRCHIATHSGALINWMH